MFFEKNQDISSEKKKKKRVIMKKRKPTLSQSASEGQLGKVIVDENEEQPDEGIVKKIGDSFQQLKVIDETEVLAAEETPRKKTGSLESEIVDEIEGQVAGKTPRKKTGKQDSEIVDKTKGQAPEEIPQKTEKIPDTCYWDRKWKEGWSQYSIQELEDNIDKTEKDFKVLIHCFTGSKDFAFKLLDLGAYISASGVVTFKKSQDLANTFRDIPNEKILVETDAPYLAPVPLRGKPNEPSYIIHTVKFLSKIKNLSFDEFSKVTTNNFFNLFGKLN